MTAMPRLQVGLILLLCHLQLTSRHAHMSLERVHLGAAFCLPWTFSGLCYDCHALPSYLSASFQ